MALYFADCLVIILFEPCYYFENGFITSLMIWFVSYSLVSMVFKMMNNNKIRPFNQPGQYFEAVIIKIADVYYLIRCDLKV